MKEGLVLGKFMPVHAGHLALIRHARAHCDRLTILHCYHHDEPIPGSLRRRWLQQVLGSEAAVRLVHWEYDPAILPDTSVSSRAVSSLWANAIRARLPRVDVVFTSEPYGAYLAEDLGIQHIPFDAARYAVPVSASAIRAAPWRYWDYLPPAVQPCFVQKVCLVGTESTGKSTLAALLAKHFSTVHVAEAGRDVVEHTDACTFDDLGRIACAHSRAIIQQTQRAHRFLFMDTDLTITKSYAGFLFGRPLTVSSWMEAVNRAHLYLFLEPDAPYVQDGTRLSFDERAKLDARHRRTFAEVGIRPISIHGASWEGRTEEAIRVVELHFGL